MKKTTPFKAPADFEKELTDFSNRYRVLLAEHAKRISDYFEMTCYNLFEDVSVRLFLSKYGIEQIATLGKKCDKTPLFEGPESVPVELKDILDTI